MERVQDVKQRSSLRKGPSEEEVSIYSVLIFTYDFNFVFALYVHRILFLLPVLSPFSLLLPPAPFLQASTCIFATLYFLARGAVILPAFLCLQTEGGVQGSNPEHK